MQCCYSVRWGTDIFGWWTADGGFVGMRLLSTALYIYIVVSRTDRLDNSYRWQFTICRAICPQAKHREGLFEIDQLAIVTLRFLPSYKPVPCWILLPTYWNDSVSSTCNYLEDENRGVLQGSILSVILFSIILRSLRSPALVGQATTHSITVMLH